jgi:uncharacterized protein (DUF58 family)
MPLAPKALIYLAIAYGFIGLALLEKEPFITAFLIPITILFVISPAVTSSRLGDLRVSRRLSSPRSFGDEDVDVSIQVQNKSSHRIEHLYMEELVPRTLNLKAGLKAITISLDPGESFEWKYRISAPRRGGYFLGPITTRTTDTMEFREAREQIGSVDQLTVLPKIEKLGILDLKARRLGPWPGLIPSRKIGSGSEFIEVAPYSPGDELRRVNWKASAKLRQLITNKFEGEQVTDALVVLDCSQGILSDIFDFDAMEFEVGLSASLCSQLLLQGNRVGLSVYGAVRTWVEPAFGKRQMLRILDNLAIVKPGRAVVPMDYAVQSVIVAVVPARSVIVVVSPLMGEEIVRVTEDLVIRGYSVICFTPTVRGDYERMSSPAMIARRISALERKLRMMQVARVARLVEVSPKMAIKTVLRARRPWPTA